MAERRTGVKQAGGRRSYGHFCGLARALDQVGDRWALLIVRELLAGPRRYTDLHTDLPGASTDMLAARLRDLEADGIVERRLLPAPASGSSYVLTERGEALAPALIALAAWGAARLQPRRATDAARTYWHALPLRALLRRALATHEMTAVGVADVVTDEGVFHVRIEDPMAGVPLYGPGRAAPVADAEIALDVVTLVGLAQGEDDLKAAAEEGRVELNGSLCTLFAPAGAGEARRTSTIGASRSALSGPASSSSDSDSVPA